MLWARRSSLLLWFGLPPLIVSPASAVRNVVGEVCGAQQVATAVRMSTSYSDGHGAAACEIYSIADETMSDDRGSGVVRT